MKALLVTLALGLEWNLLAFFLAGGHWDGSYAKPFKPEWLCAGLVASLTAGALTVWTGRKKRPFILELFTTIATYYVAVSLWWVTLCLWNALATGFSGRNNGGMFDGFGSLLEYSRVVLLLATMYAPVLVPLCWISRDLVKKQIRQRAATV